MGVQHVCDGCRLPKALTELTEEGFLQRLYCAVCRPAVRRYLDKRDVLHTKLQAEWAEKHAGLKEEFRPEIGGGVLPDE